MDFKSIASACSATPALMDINKAYSLKGAVTTHNLLFEILRLRPLQGGDGNRTHNCGFADRCLSHLATPPNKIAYAITCDFRSPHVRFALQTYGDKPNKPIIAYSHCQYFS